MELSQVGLALLFAAATACGFLMGAAYDVFAILPALCGRISCASLHSRLSSVKKPLKFGLRAHRFKCRALAVAVFFHDLVMASVSGVMLVLVIYRFNDGQFRASAPIGFALGILLYTVSLRRVITPVSELVGFGVGYALNCAAFCVYAPVRVCAVWARRAVSAIFARMRESGIKRRSEREKSYLLLIARQNGCLSGIKGEKKNGKEKDKHGARGLACGSSASVIAGYGDQRDAV